MSHSRPVHDLHYCLQDNAVEVAKMSKIILLMDAKKRMLKETKKESERQTLKTSSQENNRGNEKGETNVISELLIFGNY